MAMNPLAKWRAVSGPQASLFDLRSQFMNLGLQIVPRSPLATIGA